MVNFLGMIGLGRTRKELSQMINVLGMIGLGSTQQDLSQIINFLCVNFQVDSTFFINIY
jgi:hypothetical protein